MQEIILKIRYFKRKLSKSLKKVNFKCFLSRKSLLIGKIMKNKRGLEQVTSCSSVTKQLQKNSFICGVLPDRV